MASLLKLIDTKAENVTLLHFIVEEMNQTGAAIISNLKQLRDVLKKVWRFTCGSTFC